MADSVKVFGERNTGTNWLEDILMASVDARVLNHRGILRRKTTGKDREFIETAQTKPLKRAKREQVLDRIFLNEADDVFGWKHACTAHRRLSGMPGYETTGFVLLVKHPTWWLSSLQRRPYHRLVDVPNNLAKFAASSWITTSREFVRDLTLDSPVDLWNHKVRSYIEFAAQCPRAFVVRYEDFLADYEGTVAKLCDICGVPYKMATAVTASSKNDDMTTEQYRKKYLDTSPREELGDAACDEVKRRVDPQLSARFDYLM